MISLVCHNFSTMLEKTVTKLSQFLWISLPYSRIFRHLNLISKAFHRNTKNEWRLLKVTTKNWAPIGDYQKLQALIVSSGTYHHKNCQKGNREEKKNCQKESRQQGFAFAQPLYTCSTTLVQFLYGVVNMLWWWWWWSRWCADGLEATLDHRLTACLEACYLKCPLMDYWLIVVRHVPSFINMSSSFSKLFFFVPP